MVDDNAPPGMIIANLAPANNIRYEFRPSVTLPDDFPIKIYASGELYVASSLNQRLYDTVTIPLNVNTVENKSIKQHIRADVVVKVCQYFFYH